MRDPERIDRVIEKLRVLWHKMPDQRLGQLLSNVHHFGCKNQDASLWHTEDNIWEGYIEKIDEFGFR